MIGTVYKSTGSWHSVKNNEGVEFECRIKGRLRLDNLGSTNPIAVGDVVEFDIENNTDSRNGIINCGSYFILIFHKINIF